MHNDGQGAGTVKRSRDVTPKRQSAKASGGNKRSGAKTLRIQLHLGEKTVERLGVHCSLVHRNQSAVADEILTAYLARFGKGKELFPAAGADLLGSGDDDPTEEVSSS